MFTSYTTEKQFVRVMGENHGTRCPGIPNSRTISTHYGLEIVSERENLKALFSTEFDKALEL
jgi:hypothetical protein